MTTNEGCATICDSVGELLFYTDGTKVYNKNHGIMPNGTGLLGHHSSTQSAVIIKKPESDSIYYIFTVDGFTGSFNGLAYSEVDLTLDGNLGDVNTNKNIEIIEQTAEKVCGITHQNGSDFWIVSRIENSNTFHSYLLSSEGLDSTPVVTNIGNSYSNTAGYIRASATGDIIAAAYSWSNPGTLEIYDFDKANGTLSNNRILFNGVSNFPYGVEFSPDGKLLYTSTTETILQFDLTAGTTQDIQNSKYQITSSNSGKYAIQLGPDNKIYVSIDGEQFLNAINNPNIYGSGCNYQENAVSLDGSCNLGLPTYVNTYLNSYPTFTIENFCFRDSTKFATESTASSYLWNFGDPQSGTENTSSLMNPIHMFSDTGFYEISLTIEINGVFSTNLNTINISGPKLNLGNDTSICIGEIVILDGENPGASYLWQDGSTNQTFTTNQTGQYWVEAEINECTQRDTIEVTVIDPQIELGIDTIICEGQVLILDATTTGANYLWQDGSSNQIFSLNQSGIYWAQIEINSCFERDSIEVTVINPILNLGNDTSICEGEVLTLDATNPGATYQWQDGSNNANFQISQSGTYFVEIDILGCSAQDEINVIVNDIPLLNLGNDTSICQGENLTLDATTTGANYVWQDGSTNQTFSLNQTGIYWAQIEINGCFYRDTIEVITINSYIDLGNDTSICEGEIVTLDAGNTGADYLWQDGSTNQTYIANQSGTYSIEIDFLGCLIDGEIDVIVNDIPLLDLGNDTSICEGEVLILDASTAGANYIWQDGSINPIFQPSQSGTYLVEIEVLGCVNQDEIELIVNEIPYLELGNDTSICEGEQLFLYANTSGADYLWQDGTTNQSLIVNQTGTYSVETELLGCTNQDEINIIVNEIPNIDLGNDTSICEGENLILDATTAGANYLWQDGSTEPIFSLNQSGTYSVEIDVLGCTAIDEIEVIVNEIPYLELGNDTSICEGENLILNASTAGANYSWQDGSTNSDFEVSQTGTYTVEIEVNQCINQDTIEVYIINSYKDLGNDTSFCKGQTLNIDATTSGANYLWQDGSNNGNFEVSQTGTYTVEIELLGCNLQGQIEVIVYEIPYLELGNDTSVCEGQILNLDASTIGANYLWQDGSANPDFEVSQAGIYSLEIEVNGCKNKDEIKVNFMFIDANIIGDGLFCNINEVQASIIVTGENPPFTINYSNGEIFNTISGESPFLIDIPQEGTYYTTQVIDNKGCIDSNVDTAIFGLYPKVQASFSVEPEYAYIDDPTITFYNNSLNHYTSSWSFGDRTYYETMEEIIEHIYMFSGDFVVRLIVSNEHMCKDTTEQELSIIPIPFFVPNAFTPGSELINNTFGLSTDKVQKFQMIIFDRWGDEIYRSNDVNKPWDGTKNNQLVPIGVYVYKIDIIDLGYKSHSLVGSLSLLQ